MIPIASGVRVWIATGYTDMRRGMNSLALLVQEASCLGTGVLRASLTLLECNRISAYER
jgi:hypothetical protein